MSNCRNNVFCIVVPTVNFDPTTYTVTEGDNVTLVAVLDFPTLAIVTVDFNTVSSGQANSMYIINQP